MKPIPRTEHPSGQSMSLVLRTDFSDDAAWDSICVSVQEPDPEYGFQALVTCISDRDYDGLTVERLISLVPGEMTFIFVADRMALTHPERPILAVDLHREPGRTFRVIPTCMWAVENNLNLANMDFYELADCADPDGIFRSIPES
jgi:hypothetical protein